MKGNLLRTYLIMSFVLTAATTALASHVETGSSAATAAHSDSARAMTVKDGVFEIDVASLHVSETDALADILYLLPGMDVSKDGIITINDKEVSSISLNGKSIIEDNPHIVAKSIPVRWIKKIRLLGNIEIDIETDSRYRENIQAYATVGGGYSHTKIDNHSISPSDKFLYGGNFVLAGHGKKDDFIIVGNGGNVLGAPSEETDLMSTQDGLTTFSSLDGLENGANVGASLTTKRIDGVSVQADIVYKHSGKDVARYSEKETFGSSQHSLFTQSLLDGTGKNNQLRADLSVDGKFSENMRYSLSPYVSYQKIGYDTYASLLNIVDGDTLSASSTSQTQDTKTNSAGIKAEVAMTHLGGNAKRSLVMSASGSVSDTEQDIQTIREYELPFSSYPYAVAYERTTNVKNLSGKAAYVEPLAERWVLAIDAEAKLQRSNIDDDAQFRIFSTRSNNVMSRADGSTMQDNAYNPQNITGINDNLTLTGKIQAKYSGKAHNISAGLLFSGIENKVDIISMDNKRTSGDDKWHLKLAPTVAYKFKANDIQLSADYSISGISPEATNLSPGISYDILGSVRTGNIHLRPTHSNKANVMATYYNPKSLTTINFRGLATLIKNPTVKAYWYDDGGIQYAFPVNSEKSDIALGASLTINQPLGKTSPFSVSLTANINRIRQTNYINRSPREKLDIIDFHYFNFIQDVWGGYDGERFYSGESGFALNEVKRLRYSFNASLDYETEQVGIVARVYTRKNTYEYNRMTSTYNNTWQHRFCLEGRYSPKNGWWAYSELRYLTFNGYPEGCGDPELRWNVWIQKTLGDFTLSLTAMDIFDQAKNFRQTISANETENTFTNVLGRHALISLSYNFGK